MINKLLIANRGEIACRVIRSAKKLGIATVAVYSSADENAMHVAMADEAVKIGEAPSKDSYLRGDVIIDTALKTGADAIHPGYGFLSENAAFAESCRANNIIFVGPPPEAIRAMGSKSAAKSIMEKAGVPLVPGYHGDDQADAVLLQAAREMGYPVLLKAAAGGGGKGMRQVWKDEEFADALSAARREAMASFSDDIMLVEKYLTRPRHVEFQMFCDQHGNGVYLFERDCSLQRRHQKIIEEAPAPGMTEALRTQMGEAALQAARAIAYEGAGTVEFLLDEDESFYFMEMNTRLQVEHPVTEMITGEDLVEWQIKVAQGEVLPKKQQELTINGHAFEARLYAEDPDNGFLPETGILTEHTPPQPSHYVRVDTGVRCGDEVSVFYDPMIAKLIVWDESRERALRRLATALRQYHIAGVTTNVDYLQRLATHPEFIAANLTTTFIDKHTASLQQSKKVSDEQLAMMALICVLPREKTAVTSPWETSSSWRMNGAYQKTLQLAVAGTGNFAVDIRWPEQASDDWLIAIDGNALRANGKWLKDTLQLNINDHLQTIRVSEDGETRTIFTQQGCLTFNEIKPDTGSDEGSGTENTFTAPMNGTIVACPVEAGTKVKKDTVLVIMEAMKMEHSIKAPCDGTLETLFCSPGTMINGGSVLLEFTPDEE